MLSCTPCVACCKFGHSLTDYCSAAHLTRKMLVVFVAFSFGGSHAEWPNPAVNMAAFLDKVGECNANRDHKVWCPLTKGTCVHVCVVGEMVLSHLLCTVSLPILY